jgi:DNA-binding transcriptional ArsR family regulator
MSEDTQRVFNALADPTRRNIISTLTVDGARTATQLSQNMQITRQGVTKHLNILMDAQLISTGKQGREVYYKLTPQSLRSATQWIADIEALWDKRLASLRDLVEEDTSERNEDE